MTDPRKISINDFSYILPEDRIAKHPLSERDSSRLLIYDNGKIKESIYKNIADNIPADSLLVFNNTKVVEARLIFQKPTGGQIEIFCLEPDEQYPDITTAMLQQEKVLWQCLVGGASKWKKGQVLEKTIRINETTITLYASYIEKRADGFIIELSWQPSAMSFAEILHCTGAIPLPPYIKRAVESADQERYQTIYAQFEGSVAAPTAGLHFTDFVFTQLKNKNIVTDFVTLHVGAGTFKPVKATTLQDHNMHAEFIDLNRSVIENILTHCKTGVVAVGTTSLRTIESLYWIGVKIIQGNTSIQVDQWDSYQHPAVTFTNEEALKALLKWMDTHNSDRLLTKTSIIIAPGYQFRIIKGLVTNFHQPQSTLLLLIAALIGDDWKMLYKYALKNDFRFLSYGDGSLLWKKQSNSSSMGVR